MWKPSFQHLTDDCLVLLSWNNWLCFPIEVKRSSAPSLSSAVKGRDDEWERSYMIRSWLQTTDEHIRLYIELMKCIHNSTFLTFYIFLPIADTLAADICVCVYVCVCVGGSNPQVKPQKQPCMRVLCCSFQARLWTVLSSHTVCWTNKIIIVIHSFHLHTYIFCSLSRRTFLSQWVSHDFVVVHFGYYVKALA